MKDDIALVGHITESIGKIERFISDMTFEDFKQDEKTVSAVLRELIVIGEAATFLSDPYKTKHSNIPFHEITGMRNQIVHGYFDVRLETVWQTCQNDIPELKRVIRND